jgi:hypothetical protein
VPSVTINTGFTGEDGREEVLSEYLCDCPGCPNSAVHVIGFARAFGGGFAVCSEHAKLLRKRGVDVQ